MRIGLPFDRHMHQPIDRHTSSPTDLRPPLKWGQQPMAPESTGGSPSQRRHRVTCAPAYAYASIATSREYYCSYIHGMPLLSVIMITFIATSWQLRLHLHWLLAIGQTIVVASSNLESNIINIIFMIMLYLYSKL